MFWEALMAARENGITNLSSGESIMGTYINTKKQGAED